MKGVTREKLEEREFGCSAVPEPKSVGYSRHAKGISTDERGGRKG